MLCSTIIESVLDHCKDVTEGASAVSYFYFEYNDREKQCCDQMLRSLIAQLSLQGREAHKPLDDIYSECGSGRLQLTLSMLLETLRKILEGFTRVFIILDALDECKEKDYLTKILEKIAGWNIAGLHMLVTSRREKDIEDSLSTLTDNNHMICIESALVKDDIRAYVRSRIRTDSKLRKWQESDVQTEIEKVLVEKASGM